jgi:uncharacterized caspase-like protein
LIFYAGHGVQIDGENYLLPVDVRPDSGAQLKATTISLNTVLSGLDDRVRTTIVILDACRDNPLAPQAATPAVAGRSLTLGPGLAQPGDPGHAAAPGAGTLLAFATAPGQVALDGDATNSPFSAALIRHIGTRSVEIQTVLTRSAPMSSPPPTESRSRGRTLRCLARSIWRNERARVLQRL